MVYFQAFQFLIGKLVTIEYHSNRFALQAFQFLIGKLVTLKFVYICALSAEVSIPHRKASDCSTQTPRATRVAGFNSS